MQNCVSSSVFPLNYSELLNVLISTEWHEDTLVCEKLDTSIFQTIDSWIPERFLQKLAGEYGNATDYLLAS